MAEDHRHRFTKTGKKRFEHREGFALIFIQRVLLRIGTKRDALTKLIKAQQMFLPLLVKNLQEQRFLGHPHRLGPDSHGLFGHVTVRHAGQPFLDLGLGDAILGEPFLGRHLERQHLGSVGFQLLGIPLVAEGSRRHRPLDDLRHRLAAHLGDRVLNVACPHDFLALLEDDRSLVVHHIIEFQQLLADLEIARLDL